MERVELRQANGFVLQKQHLVRSRGPEEIVGVVRDVCGLHATGGATPYLSLFARIRDFKREDLERELYEARSLGKIRCMRKTVHVLAKDMIPIAYAATGSGLKQYHEEFLRKYLGIGRDEYETTSREVLELLGNRGMTTDEIKQTLRAGANISGIVNMMCDQGLLVRGMPRGGWRSNAHTYFPFKTYFPDIDLGKTEETEARKMLVGWHVRSYGPATCTDASWWAGLTKTETRRILESHGDLVTPVEVEGLGDDLMLWASQAAALRSKTRGRDRIINLLPVQDPYIMGYKKRERYLDEEHTDWVFDRGGNATSTILVDGRVIGVWDVEEKARPTVKLHLLHGIDGELLSGIRASASRLGRFITGYDVEVREVDHMVPLTERNAGGFLAPLKDA